MKADFQLVAERIRELREIFGFEVAQLAKKIDIPEERYLSFEQDGADIPISIMYELANIFKVDMTELLTGKSPKLNAINITRKGEGIKIERFPGYDYENIAPGFIHKKMEPMIITLLPGANRPEAVVHPGQEINYCLEGEMILFFGTHEYLLKKGDCAYFDPSYPHGQMAHGGNLAKFLTVIHE